MSGIKVSTEATIYATYQPSEESRSQTGYGFSGGFSFKETCGGENAIQKPVGLHMLLSGGLLVAIKDIFNQLGGLVRLRIVKPCPSSYGSECSSREGTLDITYPEVEELALQDAGSIPVIRSKVCSFTSNGVESRVSGQLDPFFKDALYSFGAVLPDWSFSPFFFGITKKIN